MSEPTFTTPPAVPSRLSPAEFSDRMNAFLLYFPTLQGELSTAVPWMAAAVAKATNIVASNAWASGTDYTAGKTVWSPSDLQVYKALTNHTSTVDPASDAINWLLVGGFPASHVDRVDNPHAVTAAQVGAYSQSQADALLAQKLALAGGTLTGDLLLPRLSFDGGANFLDDYEEGTWTPLVAGATTNGVASYSIQRGNYTKVGSLVAVSWYMTGTFSSAPGGQGLITGLPFAGAMSTPDTVPATVPAMGFASAPIYYHAAAGSVNLFAGVNSRNIAGGNFGAVYGSHLSTVNFQTHGHIVYRTDA